MCSVDVQRKMCERDKKEKCMRNMLFLLVFFFALSVCSEGHAASTRGYVKKNGTYVQPYQKTVPDRSKYNNYSTKGNTNPYTGKQGTVDPHKASVPKRGIR